jgi:D-sedoheptulose 7-phosphate isomerase
METEQQISAQFRSNLETVRAALDTIVPSVTESGLLIADRLASGGKVIAFGNGGSAAQADHLAAELIGRYRRDRRPYPALSLPSSPGTVTCISNDFSFESVFARQVEALASESDIVIGLTTSGTSENVLRGLKAARDAGSATILLTGGNRLVSAPADQIIGVPSASTARIQEVHLLIIHAWCELIDDRAS